MVADRSPFSAVFYSRSDGHLLQPLISQYIRELREVADVHILTVHLRTERELLWSRIQQRLLREPARAALREDQVEWMDKVLSFYDSMSWDVCVRNDEVQVSSLPATVLRDVAALNSALAGTVSQFMSRLAGGTTAVPAGTDLVTASIVDDCMATVQEMVTDDSDVMFPHIVDGAAVAAPLAAVLADASMLACSDDVRAMASLRAVDAMHLASGMATPAKTHAARVFHSTADAEAVMAATRVYGTSDVSPSQPLLPAASAAAAAGMVMPGMPTFTHAAAY
ncbi:MAG: hypothetical protein EOO41_03015 [Methanobacteriota archaeon]|nr:MAG: hypothetical protein EOO41_03015 [Euryarchaeota archaeon]